MKTHFSTKENHSKINKRAFFAKGSFCMFLLYAGLRLNVMAQATIDDGSAGANALMSRIEGTGVTLANGTFPNPGDAGAQYGTFSNGISGANLSVDSGIILATGSVTTALSSNDAANSSENTGNTYSDSDLVAINANGIYDAAIFQFEITTGSDVDAIIISYQFGSEEYPDYVCSQYNDVFGFFVSGPGITGTQNIALVPESGNVVAVNSVNGGVCGSAQDGTAADLTKSNYYIDNNEGVPGPLYIEFNGVTTLLNGRIDNLTPNTTYTFKIAIADVGDGTYDSGVIINQVIGYKSNSDSDGLDDTADLDDDNDGIDDIVEAGGNEPNGDEDGDGLENWRDVLDNNGLGDGSTTVYTDSDNNGFPDVYDTDGDGIPNHQDLDSDDDGCYDVVEAGHADSDNDGILGSSPVASDGDGRVDGQGGYTGTNSYVTTAGVAGNITGEPVAESTMKNGDATFSVSATGDDLIYQWQEFNGSVWNDITNGGSAPGYSGATTSSLSITNLPLTYNGYDYRVVITSTSYACTDLTSDEVNLEVLAPPSDAPVITDDFCVVAAGAVTEVSGSTTESTTNLVIRVYVASTETGTKSEVTPSQVVFSSGSWTAEGLSINAGQWVFATAENVDLSEPEGDFSAGVMVRTKTPDPTNSLVITSDPVAGDATLEGEVLVSTTSAYVIQLYIDGVKIPGAVASVPQGALAAIGSWIIEDLDVPSAVLYANGIATVTMDNPDIAFCESDPSAGVLIACNPSNTIALDMSQSPSGCDLTDGSIQISGLGASQAYTIKYKKDNVDVSTNVNSNASGEAIISGLNDGSYTDIYADLPSCPSNVLAGPVVLTEPTPVTISHQLSFSPTTCGGTDGYIRLGGLSGSTSYTVDYKKDGTPVSRTIAASAGQLTINNLSAGSYTDISVTSSSCTSNVLAGPYSLSDPLAPTIIYDTETNPSSCSSTDGYIRLSGLIFNNDYDYQYTKEGILVSSATPLTADVTGAIQINNLGAGTYINVSVIETGSNCQSNTIPSITLNPPDIELGTVASPTTCSGVDGSIEIINLAENTTYDLDYQIGGSPVATSTFTASSTGEHTISSLSEGVYTDITVTNNSCVSNVLSTTLTDPANPVIAEGTLVNPSTCGGANGSIQLTGLNVSTTYTVDYTLGSLVSQTLASDGSGNLTISNLAAGAYTDISVTLNNCSSNQLASVTLSDPASPTITLGQNPEVCAGETSGDLVYSATTNSPDTYSIDFDGVAEAFGFVDVSGAPLSSSPITIDIPTGADPDVYNATITVTNSSTSCSSIGEGFTISVIGFPSVPTVQNIVTNDPTPIISGSADAGVSLEVEVAGATYNLSADGSGNWSIDTESVTPDAGTFNPDVNGVNEVLVTAGVSGCEVSDVTSNELTIDTTPPTVDIQNEPSVISSSSAFTVTISFDEDVFNFVLTDVVISNGFGSNFQVVDGSTYTLDITPNMSDDVTIDVPVSVANDEATNDNTAAIQAVVPLAPTSPTVSSQITNDLTPVITGTTGTGVELDADESMTVEINGATYAVIPDASGNWSVDTETATPSSGTLGTFSNGNSYEVIAIVEDGGGNQATDISSNEIIIDTVAPTVPTVVSQVTSDTTPVISGTTGTGAALSGDENMRVTVNGATYNVTPDASGNWSIDTETAPAISGTLGTFTDGNTYQVVATVTDVAGNTATDASTDELVIDTTDPTVPTVVSQTTSDTTPVITGTTGTGAALPSGETMTVTINGATYNVTPDASGNWSVDTETATPASGTLGTFTDGNTYSVVATVTDGAGNTATDASTDELVIDTTDPTTPTVDALTSNDTTPVITGTTGTGGALPSGETMTVTINGATYNVTPDASGNWSVDTETATPASGTLGTFTDGNTYQVVATVTDGAGNTATDASTDELVIDTTDPTTPTVDALTSNDTTPVITGTTGTGAALPSGETMTVTINGATYNVTPDASGNWSVDTETATPASGTLGTFTDGNTYPVVATVTDGAGNSSTDASSDELVIDTTDPTTPTVDALTSNDTTPVITGTTGTGAALPGDENMTVTINGATYAVTPDASGNWSVDTETATPASGTLGTFTDGNTYPVVATVTDGAGNSSTDASSDELVIDTTDPTTPTVDALTSNDTTPVITGTTGTGAALPGDENMTVTINGATYAVTPDSSGNWSVDTETATPASGTLGTFTDGNTYPVVATVTDGAGNTATDASTDELVIDTTDPTTPTVDALTSNDTTPVITGTTGTGAALPSGETMTVEVNGATYTVTPDASGNWSVDTETATPASGTLGTFTDGNTYPVVATVTDGAGNSSTDASSDELVIDTTDPTTPTVDALTSNDTTPVITGTTGTGAALPGDENMTVTINGATYAVTPDASGNWSVDTETATPASGTLGTFTDGNTYPVVATVTDGAGNTATDASTDELVIDTTDPTTPTVDVLTSNDTTPVITGTTGTGAALPGDENMTVTINGATYAVTPDASGNWSVDTETATPASGTLGTFTDGNTYPVVATVTDGAGNTATDGSTDELVIDTTDPTVPTVVSQTTSDTTPVITGTTGTGAALPSGETMTVTINGATYNVTPDASGNWSVDTETATPASGTLGTFTDGNTYQVVTTVTDGAGNTATDASTDELVIDTTDPTTPTVDALTSNDTTPEITGTTGTGAALPSGETMTVEVNGATYTVTPDASGNWSVDTETATPASGTLGTFTDGNTYQVVATVTDGAGNTATDASTDELVIDTTDPTTPTVDALTSNDTTPVITGTTGTGAALPSGETMTVTINGATYNVTPDASGNWSVDTETATPASGTLGTFTDGNTYSVVATVTDGAGNTATDASTDELVIDTTDPTTPTVDALTSNDTTPVITGTTGTGGALPSGETMTVTINGATYTVTPDASGNWSVDTETATPASGTLGTFTDGNTYQVVATVTDVAGNTATDASSDELVIDTTDPTTPTVDALTSNDTTPVITGTTGTGAALPSGETMTVTINGATYAVTPDASGNWSVDTETATPASGTLGTFTDGNTYPVVATVTDGAGNTATDASTDELVIDTTDPTTPTVDALTSKDTTPVITGTTGTGAALPGDENMTVTINGATYAVTPDASGNWSVDTETATPASGTLGTFTDGNTYPVVATVTDGAGNTATDGSTDELVIDTTDPTVPTVVSQTTSDTTPVITGTTGTGAALPSGETMTVTINGATYNVTPDASGNWSVDTETATPASGTLGTFTDGNTYQVVATVTDGAGNTATDASTDELVIDTTDPTTPTVDALTSNDTTPEITGTTGTGAALPSGETMTVEVNGATYTVTPDASGNWSVDTETATPASGTLGAFSDGNTYPVVATVTDGAGNSSTDASSDELVIDTTDPTTPTVDALTSNDTTPEITGTTGTGAALPSGETMTATINGATYNVTPDASGNWSVDTETATPASGTLGTFTDGNTYQVVATVTDGAGNTATDASTDELVIDTTDPTTPTVDALTSNDTTPVITGTTGTGAALPSGETMTVTINGATYNVTPDASGNWSVDTETATPASGTLGTFTDGNTYSVVATVTDGAGNTATDASTDELVIDTTDPTTPTVDALTSNDTTPVITGTTGTGAALSGDETMTVTINGATYNVTPDASGNWSVDTETATPASGTLGTFTDGNTYPVVATVTDEAGNTATDASTDELVIDTTDPTVPTVVSQTTSDTTPVITGTTGTGAALPSGETMTVTINGATYAVTPDASGNWSVDTETATPASGTLGTFTDGNTYPVVATVTDGAGNTATDASTDELVIMIGSNENPIAVDDNISTPEDVAVTVDVLANDSDPDADLLTVSSASSETGTVVINTDGTLTVTPPADFIGEIVVTYEVSDGRGGTAIATVTVTVEEDRSLDISMEELCINDVPYVDYEVTAIGFDPTGLVALVEWIDVNGNVVQTQSNQPLSGILLWPGAEVDANGNGVNWPGWDFVDGTWIQVEDGLRNNMSVRISVNPENTLSVSYPPATPACAAQPNNPFDEMDTDGDGIVDLDEDINGDGNPDNDDTDSDGVPDYLDEDDDGDGLLSIDEDTNEDGDFTNDDCDEDGVPNYLDADQCEFPAKVLNNVISSSSPAPYNSLQIENIEDFPNNSVQVFNRWGNKVWETKGYDNNDNAFFGLADGSGILGTSGSLPVGTYFYIVDLGTGEKLLKGFVRVE